MILFRGGPRDGETNFLAGEGAVVFAFWNPERGRYTEHVTPTPKTMKRLG